MWMGLFHVHSVVTLLFYPPAEELPSNIWTRVFSVYWDLYSAGKERSLFIFEYMIFPMLQRRSIRGLIFHRSSNLVLILQSFQSLVRTIGNMMWGFHFIHFFLLDCRVFSAEAFRRTWFIHVTEIRAVLSIKSLGIAASTADYRSALKWECPKNVSWLQKRSHLLYTFIKEF